MKLRNLNNATTLIESKDTKFLFDPWLKGDLYHGAWSVADNHARENNYFTSDITHVFISHIHQDHWDFDTLKEINSDPIILIPKFGFNNVIKSKVESCGFKNIKMIDVGQSFEISQNIEGYIIPPLNGMAQEIELYDSNNISIAIDTGLVIKDSVSKTCHILLGDNSPYDNNLLNQNLQIAGVKDVDSLWFNYNGFAQDYPLCYDNLTIKEKAKISLNMALKGEKSLLKAIELISPKCLIPHSSDFVLNGHKKDEFYQVHSNVFLDKIIYASRIQKLTNIQSYGLYAKDYIEWVEGEVVVSISSDKVITPKGSSELNIPITKNKQSLLGLLQEALPAMQLRCDKLQLPSHEFANWSLIIATENDSFLIDFSQWKVEKLNKGINKMSYENKLTLTLTTTVNIMKCILLRELHFNNCCIGCFFKWSRVPNVFNKYLFDSLNFLHI